MKSMSLTTKLLKDIRSKFKHDVFVETGTYKGGGVLAALDGGYTDVHSIELSRKLWQESVKEVGWLEGVSLYCGNSGQLLYWIMGRYSQPLTIFLDAHTVPALKETATLDNPEKFQHVHCPIVDELNAIAAQRRHDHVIIIDDFDMFDTPVLDNIPASFVKQRLMVINPAFTLTTLDGARKDSILIAEPPYEYKRHNEEGSGLRSVEGDFHI